MPGNRLHIVTNVSVQMGRPDGRNVSKDAPLNYQVHELSADGFAQLLEAIEKDLNSIEQMEAQQQIIAEAAAKQSA